MERILHVDRLLREEGYPSRRDIADAFEVSIKTVERDLEYMRDRLGAPVAYDRNRRGYFYEEPGFYLPALYMSEGDALALFLSHHVGSAWRGTPFSETAQKAWKELSRLLPREVAIPSGVFSEYVHLLDRGVSFGAEHWLILLKSAQGRHKVVVEYQAPGHTAPVERRLHPYRLLHHRNAWYLLGFDEFRKQIRIYALSRIQSVTGTKEGFTLPDDFHLDDHIDPNFGIYSESEWFDVRIRAPRWMADILCEHLEAGSFERIEAENSMAEICWRTNQQEELQHWVLQWGEHVEVLEPQALRGRLARIGKAFLDRYDT